MDTYRIASFNLLKLSANTSKDFYSIAQIVRGSNVDILAIQEIYSEQALKKLLLELGPNWKGRWASPNSKSVSAAEGYAFAWNENRICLSKRKSGEEFEPVIHNQYPHKNEGELIRNPYYGRFVLKANEMTEIRLINAHIMFSQNRAANDAENHDSSVCYISDVQARKRELSILASKILPKLDDKAYDYQWNEVDEKCRKPFTILLGDYNLNLRSSKATDSFIDEPVIIIRDGNSEKEIVTIQEQLTTLKARTKDQPHIDGYKNNFDHFTYDKKRPIDVKCWAVDAPNCYYRGNYDEYRDKISDHIMIVMEISLV